MRGSLGALAAVIVFIWVMPWWVTVIFVSILVLIVVWIAMVLHGIKVRRRARVAAKEEAAFLKAQARAGKKLHRDIKVDYVRLRAKQAVKDPKGFAFSAKTTGTRKAKSGSTDDTAGGRAQEAVAPVKAAAKAKVDIAKAARYSTGSSRARPIRGVSRSWETPFELKKRP